MRALTLFPVFAELVASGAKRIENRRRPTKLRGPIAIHASTRHLYAGEDLATWARRYDVDPSTLRAGHILCIVDLVDCVSITEVARRLDTGDLPPDQSTHAIGPWCYILANPRRIEPVPAIGQLGFWRTDARFWRTRLETLP